MPGWDAEVAALCAMFRLDEGESGEPNRRVAEATDIGIPSRELLPGALGKCLLSIHPLHSALPTRMLPQGTGP
jgi:hypothetical protein